MRRPVLRLVCALAVLAMLACGAYALTSGDSLISLSYLKNTFLPQAVSQGEQMAEEKLQQTYDSAKSALDQAQKSYLAQITGNEEGKLYSGTLQPRDWDEGDEVEVSTGSSVLMLEGTACVTHSGAFVDVTAGEEVPSGGRLTANHRYLGGEDTLARITVLSGAARIGLQGTYDYVDGGVKATPFYDVCRTEWFYEPVNYVYWNELFSGMDDHHFGPGTSMNRAMLMTVLYKMAGAPADQMSAADVSFADVPDSAWYAPYVKWGAAQGITAGTGPNTFSPEQKITREQIVVLLYSFASNYLGLELASGADLSSYQDLVQLSSWAKEAMSWAVAQGIISSSSADTLTLSPQKSATRAEVATMLRAFSEKIL